MAVIAELRIPGSQFELGRILGSMEELDIELETMVPLGQRPIQFILVHNDVSGLFESQVEANSSVERIREIERHKEEVLYALEWSASRDHLFSAISGVGAQLLTGRAVDDTWAFEIRFPSRDALSTFRERCEDAHITIAVDRIYNPTKPTEGPWFGLTDPQRETLVRAVNGGYYDIPRRMSTKDLAEEFGISDQAITERLRRAVVGLTEATLIVPDAANDP